MKAEDLVLNECSKGKVVEKVGEVLPDIGIAVLAQAFVVEAIDLSDLSGFMVATKDGDALRIADLESDEQSHSLDGEIATINVVTWHSGLACSILSSSRTLSPMKR